MGWRIVARDRAPDGTEFVLYRFDDQFMIRAGGWELMSTRAHASEEALARLGCEALAGTSAPHVVIGGLGLGFTTRAALRALPQDAVVTVAEMIPAIVSWNLGAAGGCSGWPLLDPRVVVYRGDVGRLLAANHSEFDAVILDVDNGPEALSWGGNCRLYGASGSAAIHSALRPGGTLAVWSAEEDTAYEGILRDAGFRVRRLRVAARGTEGSERHVIYVARRGTG